MLISSLTQLIIQNLCYNMGFYLISTLPKALSFQKYFKFFLRDGSTLGLFALSGPYRAKTMLVHIQTAPPRKELLCVP